MTNFNNLNEAELRRLLHAIVAHHIYSLPHNTQQALVIDDRSLTAYDSRFRVEDVVIDTTYSGDVMFMVEPKTAAIPTTHTPLRKQDAYGHMTSYSSPIAPPPIPEHAKVKSSTEGEALLEFFKKRHHD